MHRRRVAAPLVLLTTLCLAGACQSSATTDTDRARTKALRAEPVLKLAVSVSSTNGSKRNGGRVYNRNQVSASLIKGQQSASTVRRKATATATELAGAGWTIYYIACTSTTVPTTSAGTGWVVRGYRMAGPVSYVANLVGSVSASGGSRLNLGLLAPESQEHANLFPDRPPAVPVTGSCLQRPTTTAAGSAKSGVAIGVSANYTTGHTGSPPAPHGLNR